MTRAARYYLMQSFGIPLKVGRPPRLSEAQVSEARARANAGTGCREIARDMGVPRQTLERRLIHDYKRPV